MHSFTFDFHLRTIHQLVSGKPTFRKGFNLVHFLDDFMMYYSKGPNFARNAIHRGSLEVPCTQEWINGTQLYNYVLSHETTYAFKVILIFKLKHTAISLLFGNWTKNLVKFKNRIDKILLVL